MEGCYGTALHAATAENRETTSDILLRYGADVSAANGSGDIPLHVAVRCGSLGIVEQLLRSNAFPNTTDKFDRTPLHLAVYYCNEEIAQTLIEHGADPSRH